ncbi:UNVERIFIED_CONTAM: KRUF family protein [Hammondia hammondi]|eukprot:XP_008888328.1 KRUF family protein [Hammondia hammondi]
MASPLPLWLTPVSAMRHLARQIDPKKPHGAGGLLSGSSTPQQLLPSARGSHGGSGPSSSTSKHARLTTGGPLPQRPTPVPTTTRPHPADVEGDFGDPTPPHPKKRRLLEFLSAHTAALETTPPVHCLPLGRLALTPTESHMASGSHVASAPPLASSLSEAHGTPSWSVFDIIPCVSLPLKKRPLRGPAAPSHAAAADAMRLAQQRPFPSGSLASTGTTSGTPSQPPSSMEPSAPASPPAGVSGVDPRIEIHGPDPH